MKFNRKIAIGCLAAVLGLATSIVVAQTLPIPTLTNAADIDIFQDIVGGVPTAGNRYVTGKVLRSYIFGSNSLHTGVPVLTSCVTGSGTIAGTDYAFILTGGSTASTSCVATFSVAFNTTPVCTVASQTAPGTTTPSYAVSTTAVTITQASNSSEVYDVICVAQAGG